MEISIVRARPLALSYYVPFQAHNLKVGGSNPPPATKSRPRNSDELRGRATSALWLSDAFDSQVDSHGLVIHSSERLSG